MLVGALAGGVVFCLATGAPPSNCNVGSLEETFYNPGEGGNTALLLQDIYWQGLLLASSDPSFIEFTESTYESPLVLWHITSKGATLRPAKLPDPVHALLKRYTAAVAHREARTAILAELRESSYRLAKGEVVLMGVGPPDSSPAEKEASTVGTTKGYFPIALVCDGDGKLKQYGLNYDVQIGAIGKATPDEMRLLVQLFGPAFEMAHAQPKGAIKVATLATFIGEKNPKAWTPLLERLQQVLIDRANRRDFDLTGTYDYQIKPVLTQYLRLKSARHSSTDKPSGS